MQKLIFPEKYGLTALMSVSHYGHDKVVEMLLQHNANVDIQNKDGVTALVAASRDGHDKVVEMLLEHNANATRDSHIS